MHFSLDGFAAILLAIWLTMVFAEPGYCQSRTVEVPVGVSRHSVSSGGVPNTMSVEMLRWESILDQSYPNLFRGAMDGRTLIEQLNHLGLPTVLSTSATDDSLDFDDRIELPLSRSSLRTRLLAGLESRNATFWFAENRIEIISLDDATDSKYFSTITYDVTALVDGAPYELMDSITSAIDPDQWMDTGQGLGAIVTNLVNGRHLVTISQSYLIHRAVQQFLNGFNRLASPLRTFGRSRAISVPAGSNAVALPARRAPAMNLGGGYFSVREPGAVELRQ